MKRHAQPPNQPSLFPETETEVIEKKETVIVLQPPPHTEPQKRSSPLNGIDLDELYRDDKNTSKNRWWDK